MTLCSSYFPPHFKVFGKRRLPAVAAQRLILRFHTIRFGTGKQRKQNKNITNPNNSSGSCGKRRKRKGSKNKRSKWKAKPKKNKTAVLFWIKVVILCLSAAATEPPGCRNSNLEVSSQHCLVLNLLSFPARGQLRGMSDCHAASKEVLSGLMLSRDAPLSYWKATWVPLLGFRGDMRY